MIILSLSTLPLLNSAIILLILNLILPVFSHGFQPSAPLTIALAAITQFPPMSNIVPRVHVSVHHFLKLIRIVLPARALRLIFNFASFVISSPALVPKFIRVNGVALMVSLLLLVRVSRILMPLVGMCKLSKLHLP